MPMRSNQGIVEELTRVMDYLSGADDPACQNEVCALFTVPLSLAGSQYVQRGKTAAGTQRYRCNACKKTFSGAGRSTKKHRMPHKNRDVFALLISKMPIRRMAWYTGLDEDFCLKFALASSPRLRAAANQLAELKFDLAALWRKNVQDCLAAHLRLSDSYSNRTLLKRGTRRLEALRDALNTEWPLLRLYGATRDLPARSGKCVTLELAGLEFEAEGADVRFRVEMGYELFARRGDTLTEERRETATLAELSAPRSFRIEVKPVVGDDYPMVLRRMKAANNTSLLVGEYNGVGATWTQVVKVFSLSQISVVTLDEVEQLSLPQGFREFLVEPLLQAQAETIIEQEFQAHLAELRKLVEQRPEPDPRTTRWSEEGPF